MQCLDREEFEKKFTEFPQNYLNQFNEFWKRKLSIESKGLHVLDDRIRENTYEELRGILKKWQYFRGSKNAKPHEALRDSLKNISYAYDRIRRYSLLEFSDNLSKPLESIWHELGCIKEENGDKRSDGEYTVVSISKPLMLLLGQTPAFDTKVRKNMPNVSKYGYRWTFDKWIEKMHELRGYLEESPEFIEMCKEKTQNFYETCVSIPYGRFIDIYFWS